jgi:hypothetical protein
MPKTYEQEILEIESARISADLAYQRERNIAYNKQLFSKKEMDDTQKLHSVFSWIASIASAILASILTYLVCHQ